MKRRIIKSISVFFVLAAAALVCFLYLVRETKPFDAGDDEGQLIKIEDGMTAKSVSSLLEDKGLIRNKRVFYACARYSLLGEVLHCPPLFLVRGVYRIKGNMSVKDIFALLSSGKTETIRVTIPEGLTITKTAARLEEAGVCNAKDFVDVCKDEKASGRYSLFGPTLEGCLFPDTYFFEVEITAKEVADVMVNNFKEHIKQIEAFDNMTGEEFYRTLILASIVEREYRAKDEAPLIAGVFENRIKAGMGLYSCATVEYIITEIEGRPHPKVIKYEDLKNDSPYNTYKWAALPPTPISNPGMIALNAAANPAATDCYYFRLADAEEGRHVFSKTFSLHIHEGAVYKTKE